MPEKEERDGSSAMLRGLELLERLAAAGRPQTLAELCAILELPKPTIHRLCQKLEGEHHLIREPGGRHYAVGPRMLRIGLNALRWGHGSERHAILQRLVDDIGETCNFTAMIGDEVLYLDRVEARWPLRLHLEPGSRVPMHCTASGKLFLASMTPRRRKALLANLKLTAFTQNTFVDVAPLEQECRLVREQGFSLDREEFLLGLFAIAVPVTDTNGQVLSAVACHGPIARFDEKTALQCLPLLRAAAAKLQSTLDFETVEPDRGGPVR